MTNVNGCVVGGLGASKVVVLKFVFGVLNCGLGVLGASNGDVVNGSSSSRRCRRRSRTTCSSGCSGVFDFTISQQVRRQKVAFDYHLKTKVLFRSCPLAINCDLQADFLDNYAYNLRNKTLFGCLQ